MKNGIFKIENKDMENIIEKNDIISNLTFTVNTEKIHDDKSFIMTVGLAWGMSEKELQEIENINWFNDILCDFIYDRYENKYKSFILIFKTWSKLNLDNIFEIGGYVYDYRKKEDYLDLFNVIIAQFSEFDENYPDDHLMDFTVLLVD